MVEPSKALTKFAYANCLFWYFEHKKYDVSDVRSISAGIVETTDVSLEKFEQIALFVESYKPNIETKQKIDEKLLRCFYLEESDELSEIIAK